MFGAKNSKPASDGAITRKVSKKEQKKWEDSIPGVVKPRVPYTPRDKKT